MESVSSTKLTLACRHFPWLLARLQECIERSRLTGYLPLHVALNSKRGDDIVRYLLEENGRATAIETNSGDLPIHIAIRKSANAELITDLFSSFEGGACIRNNDGDLLFTSLVG